MNRWHSTLVVVALIAAIAARIAGGGTVASIFWAGQAMVAVLAWRLVTDSSLRDELRRHVDRASK